MASQAASHLGQREPLKRSFLIPVLTVWLHEKWVRLKIYGRVGCGQSAALHQKRDVTSLKILGVILVLTAVRT